MAVSPEAISIALCDALGRPSVQGIVSSMLTLKQVLSLQIKSEINGGSSLHRMWC